MFPGGSAKSEGLSYHPGLKVNQRGEITPPQSLPVLQNKALPEGQLLANIERWKGLVSPLVFSTREELSSSQKAEVKNDSSVLSAYGTPGVKESEWNYGSSVLLTPDVKVLTSSLWSLLLRCVCSGGGWGGG